MMAAMAPAYMADLGSIVRGAELERAVAPTVVVNITYQCNARCGYCRWGDGRSQERDHHRIRDVLVHPETLRNLGTRRVVLSGGEPRLNPRIGAILAHYARLVDEVVVITNGYGLGPREARGLLRAGATGIAVSLDSADPEESLRTRLTPPGVHAGILRGIRRIAAELPGIDLGINATVTHPTASWGTVRGLLEFGRDAGIGTVKFQPVFDDGYAGDNDPGLLLTRADRDALLDISGRVAGLGGRPLTNPPGFWADVAAVCSGERLPGGACGLGGRQAISTEGTLGVCYWIKSEYGAVPAPAGAERVRRTREGFDSARRACKVDFHCFCTQGIDHTWG